MTTAPTTDRPDAPAAPSAPSAPSDWRKVAGVVVGLAAVLLVLLTAFVVPAINSAPRDVPLALVGPEQGVAQVEASLEQAVPGGFDVTVAADAASAEDLIRDREVYGALVLGADGLTVQTSSAASASVAAALTTAGQQLAAATGQTVQVDDVVPLTADDPRGVGLAAGALPLALGGFLAAMGSITLLRGDTRRLAAATGFAVLGGFALTAALQFGFGTFDGSYLLTALAATLGIGATSFLVLGLERLLGAPGIGLGAVLVVILGNPLSGLTSAPEMLPQPWGAVGQLLPPGATGTLLRNVAFFDGAATAVPIAVLCGYVVLGLGLFLLGSRRSRR